MSTRNLLALAAFIALAAAPAAALADFHVSAPGLHRVVISTTNGNLGSCDEHRSDAGTSVSCENGSRGTMTFYADPLGLPVCELDFWWQPGSGGAKPWHAILARQGSNAGCALQWQGTDAVGVTTQQP